MTAFPAVMRILGVVAAAPPVADSVFRMALARAAAKGPQAAPRRAVGRWLAVVPARGEGAAVTQVLRSVTGAAEEGATVETVLLLDGPDPVAGRAGREAGARVVVKEPAGPTKGAALAWLVHRHPELLAGVDAVLVVDVGSRLTRGFFSEVAWPADADAVQGWLRGVGRGVGDAVILSEALAQGIEDRGRQALGWNVHLRGTGTAFRPEVFRRIVPSLRTAVEDTEATLLLGADGSRTAMMGPGAVVEDVKPSEMDV
ncbi:MAG: hypothetical protein GXP47_11025, partial [Acidobacteria bacterium]|nr:hypothetical protein [Acidobacteriota bacterium]